jgi:hypothetical protein
VCFLGQRHHWRLSRVGSRPGWFFGERRFRWFKWNCPGDVGIGKRSMSVPMSCGWLAARRIDTMRQDSGGSAHHDAFVRCIEDAPAKGERSQTIIDAQFPLHSYAIDPPDLAQLLTLSDDITERLLRGFCFRLHRALAADFRRKCRPVDGDWGVFGRQCIPTRAPPVGRNRQFRLGQQDTLRCLLDGNHAGRRAALLGFSTCGPFVHQQPVQMIRKPRRFRTGHGFGGQRNRFERFGLIRARIGQGAK